MTKLPLFSEMTDADKIKTLTARNKSQMATVLSLRKSNAGLRGKIICLETENQDLRRLKPDDERE